MQSPEIPAQQPPLQHAQPAQPAQPDAVVRGTRAFALAGLLALVVLCLGWELWWAPTGNGTWAVKALPLMLCVVGLARHRMYTFRWLSLLLWLYVLEGLVRATSEPGVGRWLAVGEVALSVFIFAVSGWYIRWRLAHPNVTAAGTNASQNAGTVA